TAAVGQAVFSYTVLAQSIEPQLLHFGTLMAYCDLITIPLEGLAHAHLLSLAQIAISPRPHLGLDLARPPLGLGSRLDRLRLSGGCADSDLDVSLSPPFCPDCRHRCSAACTNYRANNIQCALSTLQTKAMPGRSGRGGRRFESSL